VSAPAPPSPASDRSDLADALLLLVEIAGLFGAPLVSAVARTVRQEYPELIATLERALEGTAPELGPTPPTAEAGRVEVLRRRADRMLRRFRRL
jgi:hypothetical protein